MIWIASQCSKFCALCTACHGGLEHGLGVPLCCQTLTFSTLACSAHLISLRMSPGACNLRSAAQMNDFLISKDQLSHRIALVGASTCMLAGGLVILGFMYHYYAPYASCSLNIFFITWTLIMALFFTGLSVRSALQTTHSDQSPSVVFALLSSRQLSQALICHVCRCLLGGQRVLGC